MGIAIMAVMVAFVLNSYSKCKGYVSSQKTQYNILTKLATNDITTTWPECVRERFAADFQDGGYKVSRQDFALSLSDLKSLASSLKKFGKAVFTNTENELIDPETMTDPPGEGKQVYRGFVWLAELD